MKTKILNNFPNIIVFFLTFLILSCDQKTEEIKTNQKINILVFSSLTCPHCANFHEKVIVKFKKDDSLKNVLNFEHRGFPLDLAALNAEVVVRCQTNNDKKFELLEEIYNKQKFWAVGSDINKINDLIKQVGANFDLTEEKMNSCLADDSAQDEILNQRIDAQKKYKIDSTPTVIINEKKYTNKVDYKTFKKIIEKNL